MQSYSQLHLDNQLCFTIYSASRLMTQLYAPFLTDMQITYPQYLVFLVLWQNKEENGDGLTVRAIGNSLMLDSGTLSPLLKRLELQGMIKRIRSKEDERQVRVTLTKKGWDLREKAKDVPNSIVCRLDAQVDELMGLRDSLKDLIHILQDGANKLQMVK
jgi:MarR family transcriptional regulator, organic hydroperoxide resistance regulator